jgi:hypothetical protein
VHVWASSYYEWRKRKKAVAAAITAASDADAVAHAAGALAAAAAAAIASDPPRTATPPTSADSGGASFRAGLSAALGERLSVPREEMRRLKKYFLFCFGVTAGALGFKVAFNLTRCGIWMSE